jgi:hypothetical protein
MCAGVTYSIPFQEITMKTLKVALVLGCVLMSAVNGMAQKTEGTTRGIAGYLDAQTGAFHPLPSASTDSAEPQATFGGKFVFSFTINVQATIASTAKIGCGASATVVDGATGIVIIEQAGALATRSGSTATCTVNIPYSWNLSSGSTDKVSLTYTIQAPVEAAAAASFPNRYSNQGLGSISVPANGTTTTETITATF